MTSHQAVKSFKKSSVPGVIITQFVDDIPNGCSTPDFERKPVTLTLQEGKNAIFRAVVKGVPTPEVKWTRMQGGMDDPAKYETFFNNVTNEFILQINKLTTDDSDLYRCFAVNEYGEAACSAGLRIIQVGFKRKARYVPVHPADELKKKLQDFRKLLRKRAPAPKPKPLDKEAVWQLLLHADRRDYEKICMKYGIVDFRGMLRKLQEMRKDTESEQGELLHSIRNFEHIKVNKDGKATFSLVMDLKNHNSKVYLLKDGERLRYGTGDEYRKHCLRRIGKRYSFIVNDVQPEDAGVYQVRVEDIPVFSTELDAESIPVRFQQPLSDVRCPEEEDAVFDCILRTPCYDAVWLHKTHLLEGSEKHQISVTPDGLTHQLIIRNVVPSDNGMYTLDTGLCSSNAWLIVEYAKGKRRQGEGDERQKSEWLKETLPDKDRAKKLRRREYVGDEDHLMDTDVEKDGWYRNGQIGSEGHSTDVDGNHRFLGKDELHGPHRNRRMGFGQFSGAELGGDSMTNDDSNFGLKGLGGKTGLRPFRGKDSMTGRADTGDELGGAGEWYSADGRDDGMVDAVNIDMDNGEGVRSQHGKDGKLGDSRYRAGFGGVGRLGATDGSSVLNRLDPDSTGVGDGKGGKGDLLSRTSPGTGARKNAAGAEIAGGMKSPYGKDGLPTVLDMNGANINREGQIGTPYGKDGPTLHASGHLGQEGRSDLLDSPGLLPAGHGAISGAGGSSIGEMEAPYGPDGRTVGASIGGAAVAGAGAVGSPYGKDGLPTATGIGGAGIAGVGGVWSAYGKDGFPAGAGIGGAGVAGVGGVGSPYGKDGLPAGAGVGVASAGGVGSPYGKDGLPAGVGVGGAGAAGAEGIASPYGKDGLPAGAGVGVAGAGGVGSPYGKDGLPAGAGIGVAGVAGVGGVGSPYGKDGLPAGAGMGGAGVAGVGGVGSPYGKDGLPAGAGIGGAGVAGAGGVGSPYGKDGLPAGAVIGGAGVAGSGGVGSPYGKDGLPARAGIGGASVGGAGGVGSPYGKDGFPAGTGVGGAGGVGSPYGKDGLPAGASMGGAGVAGVGGVGSPYGKDGLPAGAGIGGPGVAGVGGVGSPYGKDGLPAGAGMGGAGVAGAGGVGSPYGKDGLPASAGVGGVAGVGAVGYPYGKDALPAGTGVAGAGGVGSPYGKDGLPAGTGVAGVGGVGSPYGKDGLPAGAGIGGAGVAGAGAVGSPYGKDHLPAGTGVAGAGGVRSPYGKDGPPAGAGIGGAGVAGAGGVGSPCGKDGLLAGTGVAGVGGVGSPYGKGGLPTGAVIGGAGVAGAGGVGSPYGKDGLPAGPAGVGLGGSGVAGARGIGSPYGKDGLPVGMGAGAGSGGAGFGRSGSPYGKDGLPTRAVAGAAHFPFGGEEVMGSRHGRDALLSRAQGGAAGNGFSSEGGGVSGSAIRGAGSPYGKDSGSAGARAGVGGVGRLGGDERELHSVPGKEGVVGAVGRGGEYGLDSHSGKSSMGGKTGKGTASEFRASGNKGSSDDRDSLSGQRDARSEGRDLGYLGSLYGKNSAFGGAGSKSHNRSVDGRNSGGFGQGSLDYGQMSDLYGGPPSINQRKQEPSLDIKANDFLKNTESMGKRRRYCLDDLKAPRCYVNKQLLDVRVLKGEPAELSCTVSKHEVAGTWFKDGLKLTNMDGVLFEKEGLVHKLIINKVEDIHAGKYRFEGGDIKTEASIFVEDPPQVDKVLLKNLTSVPTVAKAGQKVKIKIPFEGRLPIRATWLKDRMELVDDARIRVDKTETFTMLSISSSERKDCGDYQVRLKNDSGVLEINLKLMVIDKPQPPAGPIKIVESSANNITIQWKPPKDDGGKPVQRYIVERQQVGKNDWVTLGETPRSCTTFTANKVEQDRSYYFRVRAVNAEGTSDALESDEVKAAGKASPGAPDPPEIVSASRDTITICWKAPRKTGSSRIVGYIVQKRKKGTMTWLPVNNVPIADKKLKMTNLKKGLQYEFRVAAVNAAGIGDASEPSQPVFARDSMKSPGRVQDLKVSSSDSTSVTLTWKRPEAKDGSDVKGYEVEMRSSKSLNWTKCNNLPIEMTTYTVKGLQAKEIYFLRVRALNDSGPGEAAELEACIEAAPPVVSPRLLIDDTVKSFLVIKAGNTIRVNIPFEASPDPVVTWLKDGLPLSNRAKINTKDGTTQLLIAAAEFADSGTYTVELQNGLGRRETFSFEVQITDIPQSPGPIQLEENVPNTVTVTWEPSPSEKWESNLYYTVLKRESQKGLWHVVGDLIYTNKFTFTKLIPGRDYYFRVVAKNSLGASDPSETVQPWSIRKPKAEFQVKPQKYRGVNQNQPPRFLVPLKPHVVTTGSECHMSCAVGGHPPPKITWYKDSRDLSNDPTYFCTNDFGVCSLVVLGVTKHDEGEYMVEATNESGRAFSKAFLTIKDSTL
ncbi:immunoglobulin-like and fibronectin type III domain-containing protein 1 isoform X8 [Aquila chrysaetos chrysaetos]|uniref:immunoglobulin-like and fibronectin type III domain-containing protein 1 isoform X8 n=1 Tax=Aquila chrysaetos chrysaetos TaxID=223781 RepID=UPI001176756A|nr:immunoglobulin-like and fibronectin type III domain-containing protein 1 isoform X8 [Aquila chrysaetos chrysaetos]